MCGKRLRVIQASIAAAAFALFSGAVTTVVVVAAEVGTVLLGSTVAVTIGNPRGRVAFASAVAVFDFISTAGDLLAVFGASLEAFAAFADAVTAF